MVVERGGEVTQYTECLQMDHITQRMQKDENSRSSLSAQLRSPARSPS